MADTLKEFLVGIGFKVDASAQTRAEAAVKRTEERNTKVAQTESAKRVKVEQGEAEKKEKVRSETDKKERERQDKGLKEAQAFILKMAAFSVKAVGAVAATATGVVYAVDQAAKSLDKLNYASQRIGAAPGKISAFAYASSQLGVSAGEADASLESFGKKLRQYGSGYTQGLDRLGVKTRDANGHMRDTVDIATDLGDALARVQKNQGYKVALNYGNTFGFDENQVRAMTNPNFRAREAQYSSDQAKIGADPNEAAKGATAFEQSMRHLAEVAEQIKTKVSTELFQQLEPQIDKFAQFLTDHGKEIADGIIKIAEGIGRFAEGLAQLVQRLGGDAGATALFAAFGVVLATKVLSPLGAIVGLIRTLSGLALPPWVLAMVGAGAATLSTAQSSTAAIAGSKPGQNDVNIDPENGTASPASPGHGNVGLGAQSVRSAVRWARKKMGFSSGLGAGRVGMVRSGGRSNPTGKWWTTERMKHAADRLVNEAGLSQAGAAGLVARWAGVESASGPSSVNPNSGASGIGQWLGSRKGPGSRATDPFDDQIGHAVNELNGSESRAAGALRSAKTPSEGARGASMYERAEGYDGRTGIDNFTGKTPAQAVYDAVYGNHATSGGFRTDAQGFALNPDGTRTQRSFDLRPTRPLGDTPAVHGSVMNQTRGDTNVTHNPSFVINSNAPPLVAMEAARKTASRGTQDLLRNLQGAEQ